MAGGRIIGVFGFGGRTGLAVPDIITILGTGMGNSLPKRPIMLMLRGLVIVQLRQNLCLRGVAAGTSPECGAGGGGCRFLGGDPVAKGMTQSGDLGIRIGITTKLTGMRGIASSTASGRGNLDGIIVGLLRGVIVYIGVLADGTGMGGIASGSAGGSGYGIFVAVRQTINVFGVAAAAGTGVGLDTYCCTGRFSGDLKGVLVGVSFYKLIQLLLICCTADSARTLGQSLRRSSGFFRYHPFAPGMAGSGPEVIFVAIAAVTGVDGEASGGTGGLSGILRVLMDMVQGDIIHIDPALGDAAPDGSVHCGLFKYLNDAATLQLGHDIKICTGSLTDIKGIRVVHDAGDAHGGGFNSRFGSWLGSRLCGCLRCSFGGGFCSWYGGGLFRMAFTAAV